MQGALSKFAEAVAWYCLSCGIGCMAQVTVIIDLWFWACGTIVADEKARDMAVVKRAVPILS